MTKSPTTELIVALDVPDRVSAGRVIAELDGLPVIYKVGFELFLSAGPDWVRTLTANGHRIFLDLKFHDIPNTVAQGAKQAAQLGVEYFTLHLAGGSKMIRAVREAIESFGAERPKILGVSVLTSFDDESWSQVTQAVAGSRATVANSVKSLARFAQECGVDGLVCSPQELSLANEIAPRLIKVVPGIRPEGSSNADQARVMTPAEASRDGANAIVVGRPILQAKDRRRAVEKILAEFSGKTLPGEGSSP